MRDDRPSTTALTIALSLLWLSRRSASRHLVHASDADTLARRLPLLGLRARAGAALARAHIAAPLVRLLERLLVPGILAHFALRKRAIEQQARLAFADGCRQLVVIAAGFDLLAPRLARENPDLRASELDHPATQRAKRALLGGDAPPNLTLLPADLATTLVSEALAAAPAFDRAARTTFVVEGLTMYLTLQQIDALLRDLTAIAAPGSRLICTFMEPGPSGHAEFHREGPLLRALLRWGAEPMKWGIARSGADAFFERRGWKCVSLLDPATPTPSSDERHLRAQKVGEYIIVCERAPA